MMRQIFKKNNICMLSQNVIIFILHLKLKEIAPIKRNSAIGRIRLFIGNVRFCQRIIQTVRNPFEIIVIVFLSMNTNG